MPVPGPPPAPRPAVPAPPPGPAPAPITGTTSDSPALDEVRARLVALDGVPLEQHPEQFTSIDTLLRSALDGTDRSLRP